MNFQETRYNNQLIPKNQNTITKQEGNKGKKYDLEERTTKFAKAVIRLCKSLSRNPINDRLASLVVLSSLFESKRREKHKDIEGEHETIK